MASRNTSYPAPRELGLLEGGITAAGPVDTAEDYMVAIDSATGKTVASWKGTNKRLSLGDGVVQYHVGKHNSAAAARRSGAMMFSAHTPGE